MVYAVFYFPKKSHLIYFKIFFVLQVTVLPLFHNSTCQKWMLLYSLVGIVRLGFRDCRFGPVLGSAGVQLIFSGGQEGHGQDSRPELAKGWAMPQDGPCHGPSRLGDKRECAGGRMAGQRAVCNCAGRHSLCLFRS